MLDYLADTLGATVAFMPIIAVTVLLGFVGFAFHYKKYKDFQG